jgi:hypothetical protein
MRKPASVAEHVWLFAMPFLGSTTTLARLKSSPVLIAAQLAAATKRLSPALLLQLQSSSRADSLSYIKKPTRFLVGFCLYMSSPYYSA